MERKRNLPSQSKSKTVTSQFCFFGTIGPGDLYHDGYVDKGRGVFPFSVLSVAKDVKTFRGGVKSGKSQKGVSRRRKEGIILPATHMQYQKR